MSEKNGNGGRSFLLPIPAVPQRSWGVALCIWFQPGGKAAPCQRGGLGTGGTWPQPLACQKSLGLVLQGGVGHIYLQVQNGLYFMFIIPMSSRLIFNTEMSSALNRDTIPGCCHKKTLPDKINYSMACW